MGKLEDEIAALRAALDAFDGGTFPDEAEQREAYLDGLARAAMYGEGEESYSAEEVEKLRAELERLRPVFEKTAARLRMKGWAPRGNGTWGLP